MYNVGGNNYLVTFNGGTGAFERINNQTLQGVVPTGALDGRVYVNRTISDLFPSSTGQNGVSQDFILRHQPPVYDYATPNYGTTGQQSTIFGTNFYNVTGLFVSGITGSETAHAVITSTGILNDFIKFTIPNLSAGRYNLTIKTIAGNITGSGFLIKGKPIVTSFSPSSGAYGNLITITGYNLYEETKVYFNQVSQSGECLVPSGNTGDYRSVRFKVPFHAQNSNTIIVDNLVGTGSGTSSFMLIRPPFISGVVPTSGVWGSTAQITGGYFHSVSSVKIGQIPVTNYSVIGSTGIRFIVPTGSVANYLRVDASGGTLVSNLLFSPIITNPIISGFMNPIWADRYLLISGLKLTNVTGVSFSGIPYYGGAVIEMFSDSIIYSGDNYLSARLPYLISPNNKFRLYSSGNSYVESSSNLNMVEISGYSHLTGIYNQRITISGSNIQTSIFYFNGVTGNIISGDSHLRVGTTGTYLNVPREIKRGTMRISGARNFMVPGDEIREISFFTPIPTITGFSVSSAVPNQSMVITGINAFDAMTGFVGMTGSGRFENIFNTGYAASINFYNITGSQVTNPSTGVTYITIATNKNFGGSGNILLTSLYDREATGQAETTSYAYKNASGIKSVRTFNLSNGFPTIQSFSPLFGTYNQVITVNGSALDSATGVYLSGLNPFLESVFISGEIQSKTFEELTFLVPSGFSGISGKVKLYNINGDTNSSQNYTFYIAISGNIVNENLLRIPTGSIDPIGRTNSTLIFGNYLYYKNSSGWLRGDMGWQIF
jgi:hypothetical protein